jgi:hypothetical protein
LDPNTKTAESVVLFFFFIFQFSNPVDFIFEWNVVRLGPILPVMETIMYLPSPAQCTK